MIEQLLLVIVDGFPQLAALALLAYVFIMKDRQAEKREREREQWFMSILEKVLRIHRTEIGTDNTIGQEETG